MGGENLVHEIRLSVTEASDGWRREVSHPSGVIIEIQAVGPTNIGHFLEMQDYGIPTGQYSCGKLFFWITVSDTEGYPDTQLDDLKRIGGPFFGQVQGLKGQIYESAALGLARKSVAYNISRSVYKRQKKERKERAIAGAI